MRLLGLAVALLLTIAALMLPDSQKSHAQTVLPTVSIYATEKVVIKEGTAASFTIVADPAPPSALAVAVSIGQSSRVVSKMGPIPKADAMRSYTIPAGNTHKTFTIQTTDHPDKNSYDDHFPRYDKDGVQLPGFLTPYNGPNRCGAVTALLVAGSTYKIASPRNIIVDVYDANTSRPGCNVDESSKARSILASVVSISPGADVTEGSPAQFTLDIAPPAITDFTLNLTVSDGSGSDFVSTDDENSQSVSIAVGESSKSFSVATTRDNIDEPNGEVTVAIADGTGYYTPSASSASVGVLDDDATKVTLDAATSADIPETDGTKEISATLSRPLVSSEALDVEVNFEGAATPGTDYTVAGTARDGISYGSLTNGSVVITFTGGSGASDSAALTLAATSDDVAEDDEAVKVKLGALSSNSGVNLGGGATHSNIILLFTILDDDRPPSVGSITVGSVTQTSATATVNLADAGTAQKTVYLRHRAGGGSWGTAQSGATNGASEDFTISGLNPGTAYEVEASLANDFSGSVTVTFTTLAPPPSASSVSISGITQTSATATVSIANAGTAQKTVYLRYRASGGSWGAAQSGTTSGSSRAFGLTGLTAGTTYNVQASLANDFSGSQTATFTTLSPPQQLPNPTPTATPSPSASSVSISGITQTSATATVNIANAGAAQKTVYLRHRASGGSWGAAQSGTTSGASGAFSLTGLTAGTTYNVQASLANDFSGSQTATFTTLSPPQQLPNPTPTATPSPSASSVSISGITQTSATATVNIANAGAAQKTVYLRHRASGGSWGAAQSGTTSGASGAFSLTGLTAGTTYNVQASLANDFSGSQTATFTTLSQSGLQSDPGLQSQPNLAGLQVSDITQISAVANAQIENPGTGENTAYLRHRELGSNQWSAIDSETSEGETISFYINSLDPGATCEVQVSLDSDFETYEYATFTTLAAEPSVSAVSISDITQTSATATVSIDDAGTAQKTVYLRQRASGEQWGAAQTKTTGDASTTFSLTNLSVETSYEVEASLSSDFTISKSATFTTLAAEPIVSAVSISDITQISAVADAQIENPGTEENTAYLRHRELGTTQWSAIDSETSEGETISFYINSLDPGATCEVQVSLDSDFETYKYATFTTLAAEPSVSAVSISDITQTSATATVSIADAGTAQKSVYLRHRASGVTNWSIAPKATISGTSANFGIVGLTPGTAYEAQASLSSDFSTYTEALFTTAAPDPSVSSISISNITQTSAAATVNIANAGTTKKMVYLHYRANGEAWSALQSYTTTFASATFNLTGLIVDAQYEVEASLDATFSVTASRTFNTLPLAPVVSSISIASLEAENIGRNGATVSATIADSQGESQPVYVRHRQSRYIAWGTTQQTDSVDDIASFRLRGLSSGTEYIAEASLDSSFPDSASMSVTFTTKERGDDDDSSSEVVAQAARTVDVPLPGFSPQMLRFTAIEGGDNPSPQTFSVWNRSQGTMDFTLPNQQGWLSQQPTSGTSNGPADPVTITAAVDSSELASGQYVDIINIDVISSGRTPGQVIVALDVLPPDYIRQFVSRDEGGTVILPDGTVKIVVQPVAPPKDVDIELMKLNLQAHGAPPGERERVVVAIESNTYEPGGGDTPEDVAYLPYVTLWVMLPGGEEAACAEGRVRLYSVQGDWSLLEHRCETDDSGSVWAVADVERLGALALVIDDSPATPTPTPAAAAMATPTGSVISDVTSATVRTSLPAMSPTPVPTAVPTAVPVPVAQAAAAPEPKTMPTPTATAVPATVEPPATAMQASVDPDGSGGMNGVILAAIGLPMLLSAMLIGYLLYRERRRRNEAEL